MDARGLVRRVSESVRGFAADSPALTRGLLLLTVFSALTFVWAVSLVPSRFVGVRVGRPAPRTVQAPVAVRVVDEVATKRLRDEAAAEVEPQYDYDPLAIDRSVQVSDRFFDEAVALATRDDLGRSEKVKALDAIAPTGVSDQSLRLALGMRPEALRRLGAETRKLLSVLMSGRVTEEDLDHVREMLTSAAIELELASSERRVVTEVGRAAVAPTFLENAARRAGLEADARQGVRPVMRARLKGEVIVRQGEVVTREHMLLMEALKLTSSRLDPSLAVGSAMVVGLLLVGTLGYLFEVEREVYDSTRDLVIVSLLMLLVALAGKLVLTVSPMLPVSVVPVALAPMLVTLLVGPRIGLAAALGASVVVAGATQFSGETLLWSLITSLASVFAMARVSKRTNLYPAGATVIVAGALAAGAVSLFAGSSVREGLSIGAYGLAGGLLATVLAVGLLPLLESAFEITTDIRLADLVNPNQPLLKELMLKASGTYSHSTTVASLAEAAADAIGANALLARAGAYYHDIGKLKRPSFFVENQQGQPNPHDHTNPRLSSLVITAHVTEGVARAEKANLPVEVVDIIKQHHGTGVVTYFYQRAVEEHGYQSVNEDDFRYEGERPQSPEAAVVMLADGVEAAARALAKPTPQRLEQAARKIVQQRVDDGQLDESRLTMCDLDTVVRAFTTVLAGMYHPRVEYPEPAAPAGGQPRRAASSGHRG